MGYWMPTDEEILEAMDPDWRAHFAYDPDRAAEHYRKYAREQWDETEAELAGEDFKEELDTAIEDAIGDYDREPKAK